jgi:HSP20 family protein
MFSRALTQVTYREASTLLDKTNRMGQARRVDRVAPWTPFRELFGFDPFGGVAAQQPGYEYDVARTDDGYEIEIAVPGFKADQIEVTFKDGVLTTSGRNDRRAFSRSLTVPDDVEPDGISAHVEDGVLTLKLRRRPEAQPKKISITTK